MRATLKRLLEDTSAQVGGRLDLMAVMITVISAGVTAYVGIEIMDTTEDSNNLNTTAGQDDPANASGFDNASADLTDGLDSFFGNVGTVFTVIILVVILSYLMLLRGR